MLWPTASDTDTDADKAKLKAFHLFHHGTKPTEQEKLLSPEPVIRSLQLKHYSDTKAMWEKELVLMAWCGALYDNRELFFHVRRGSTDACAYTRRQMARWLPKVIVGATFRKSYR